MPNRGIQRGETRRATLELDGLTGPLSVNRGGTGIESFTQGDIIYASAAGTLSLLAKNASATRYLSNTGTSNNPAWAQIDLTNGVTGTLPAGNLPTASTTASGIVELATDAEAVTGTDNTRPIVPSSLSARLAAPGAIGGTTPGPGSFTSLSASSTITPNQTAGIVGTTTNNNAQAGSIGEVISSTVAVGSPVALTTATAADVTSISLTAGDWDVSGSVGFLSEATTSITKYGGAVNSVSATFPAIGLATPISTVQTPAVVWGVTTNFSPIPTGRISLSATTTIYLIARATFTVAALSAFGYIMARRVR